MKQIKKYGSRNSYLLGRQINKKKRDTGRSITTAGARKEKKKQRRLSNR